MEESWIKVDFCNVDFEPPIVVWAVDDTRAWINGTTEKERNSCIFSYLRNNIMFTYIIPTLQFFHNSWRLFSPFLPPSLLLKIVLPPTFHCLSSNIWKFIFSHSRYENTMVCHGKLLLMSLIMMMMIMMMNDSVEWLTEESTLSFISSLYDCRIDIWS